MHRSGQSHFAVIRVMEGACQAFHAEGDFNNEVMAMRLFIMACLVLVASACASDLGGTSYERGETGTVQRVQHGTVVSLTPVRIEGTQTGIGAGAGAVVGGIAGGGVGGGRGSNVAAVIGAVAGGLLGAASEEGATRTSGVEIGIRTDDGREISIVQELEENEVLRVGDEVRVLYTGSRARVVR